MSKKDINVEQELKRVEENFQETENQIKSMTMDKMKLVPRTEYEPQTKISQQELKKTPVQYLKPLRTISSGEKFNEIYRPAWEVDKKYVDVIAEHRECPNETIEMWTKPYAGVPAEFWIIPTNVPISIPLHVAEQIKRKFYHRLAMKETTSDENNVGGDGVGKYYGKIVVDQTINRLDCFPATTSRQQFYMGSAK